MHVFIYHDKGCIAKTAKEELDGCEDGAIISGPACVFTNKARSKGEEHCHHQKASEALNWYQRGRETSTELRDITMKNEAIIVSTRRRNRRRKLYSHHARLRRIPLLFLLMLVTVCGDDVKETETGDPFLAGVPTLGPSLSPSPSLIPLKVPDVVSTKLGNDRGSFRC